MKPHRKNICSNCTLNLLEQNTKALLYLKKVIVTDSGDLK